MNIPFFMPFHRHLRVGDVITPGLEPLIKALVLREGERLASILMVLEPCLWSRGERPEEFCLCV